MHLPHRKKSLFFSLSFPDLLLRVNHHLIFVPASTLRGKEEKKFWKERRPIVKRSRHLGHRRLWVFTSSSSPLPHTLDVTLIHRKLERLLLPPLPPSRVEDAASIPYFLFPALWLLLFRPSWWIARKSVTDTALLRRVPISLLLSLPGAAQRERELLRTKEPKGSDSGKSKQNPCGWVIEAIVDSFTVSSFSQQQQQQPIERIPPNSSVGHKTRSTTRGPLVYDVTSSPPPPLAHSSARRSPTQNSISPTVGSTLDL